MCGIAGILNFAGPQIAPVTEGELRTMADAIGHRGPDADGFHLDPGGRCGLAFRRLAIIDLATGGQPLSNEDGTLWLVFNGEIYNFRVLREELVGLGHTFRTQSDSEVIVHAYQQWGTDCFARLHGMFAIALWDQRNGQLILARDRLGKKPLYTWAEHGRLHFASELKAILALTGLRRAADWSALHSYLLLQYVPVDRSIYAAAKPVAPGTWVRYSANGAHETEAGAYWSVPSPAVFPGTYEEAQKRLGELLTSAVQKRLISDVSLGAFLSGGVDSSIVVGLMRRLGVSPLRTFSIGFEDPRYNEAPHAQRVAKAFQTEHHEHIVAADSIDLIERLAEIYDEPFADSSALPTLLLSQWTQQSVTVALTGDGGDECFGGYDRYRAALLAERFERAPLVLRRLIGAAAALVPHGRAKSKRNRLHRFLETAALPPSRRYARWLSVFTPEQLAAGYRPEIHERVSEHAGALQPTGCVRAAGAVAEFAAFPSRLEHTLPGLQEIDDWYSAAGRDAAHRAAYVDFRGYLPGDLLTKVDRASMSCGLECRCPFLDHELVEFGLSLPTEWKVSRAGGKQILKDWAVDLLPRQTLQRSKMGFGVPLGEWFRGAWRQRLLDAVLSPDGVCAKLFLDSWLRALLEQHLSGAANHEHRLWALLMLDAWHRRWQPEL